MTYILSSEFDREDFLANYWQKKPLVIRQLFKDFTDPLSAEELAGCACEELVESRVVTEFNKDDYRLRNGPFQESDFTSLPEENWTLLVQAMDQWFDEIADLRQAFDFVPNWRVDDVMLSFACKDGGVGPHYDNYDVFLLQGKGRRTWRLGQLCDESTALRDNAELRLLEAFEETEAIVLEPGDALYIPPRVAHWGVSEDDSLCYSIGFRAPSKGEMLEGFSDFLIRDLSEADRFVDPLPSAPRDASAIQPASLDASFEELRSLLDNKALFQQWFGCHVTQPKYPEMIEPLDDASLEVVEAAMEDARSLRHHPASRFAYMLTSDSTGLLLFVDGNAAVFDPEHAASLASLCQQRPLAEQQLDEFLQSTVLRELILRLLRQGSLLVD